jgi:hypothetical protein
MRCLVAGIEQLRRKAADSLDPQVQDVGEIPFPVYPWEAARFWLSHYAARRGCAYDARESADGIAFCRVRERVAQWWRGSMLEVSSTRTAIAERLRAS